MRARDVIERGGGVAATAKMLRLKRTAVQMWNRDGPVPPKHALAVARALNVPVEAILDPDTPAPPAETMERAA